MRRIVIAVVAASLLHSADVSAQVKPPAPSAPREARVPQPVEKTLDNGLRVIVIEKRNVPLVSARLLLLSGAEADAQDRAGVAQATAFLLTKGTKTRTAEQIARGVEALGASLSAEAGWDSTAVDLGVISTKLSQAFEYLGDVVRNPTFKQDEVERARQQGLDSLRVAMEEPRSLAGFVANKVLFGDAPYGHYIGGTLESMQKITRDDVVAFHKRYYRPDNAVLVIGGDVKPETAFALAKTTFGTWSRPGTKLETPSAAASAAAAKSPRVIVIDMPTASQAAVVVTRPGLRRVDPRYFTAMVTNSILGGGYSSRLNQEIRIKRGLSYGAGSTFDLRREVGPFTARAETKNESAAEVARIILEELKRLASGDIPDTELTPRKAVLIGGFGRSLETSSGIVGRVATLALFGLPLSEINKYISGVQGVKSSDVQSFAAEHVAKDANVIIVGDAKQFLEPLKKQFENVEVIPFAELDLNTAALRVKQKVDG